MDQPVSIDIVIPSFRLQEKLLLPMLDMPVPPAVRVTYYIIADNPGVQPAAAIKERVDHDRVFLVINEQNIGAAMSRNKGIEMGSGNWVLLLDDDIIVPDTLLAVYAAAIRLYPGEIGFIGLVDMPPPPTAFAKAIQVSGSMDVFAIAKHRDYYTWGATANMLLKRDAIGSIRFSPLFPKAGGGEDIDFFLRLREQHQYKMYKTLPEAVVLHPWWNQDKVSFKRPFRYGTGNSLLGRLDPAYTYRDWLNTPETLLLLWVSLLVCFFAAPVYIMPLLYAMAGVLLIEWIATIVQGLKRKAPLQPAVFVYLWLLRFSYESGMLWGHLSKGRVQGIGERFNDSGIIKKIHFYRSNSYRITKWILYPLLIYWLISTNS